MFKLCRSALLRKNLQILPRDRVHRLDIFLVGLCALALLHLQQKEHFQIETFRTLELVSILALCYANIVFKNFLCTRLLNIM